jgi:hypothetical protein
MSDMAGRHSDTVTEAVHAAQRARRNKCTCFKPYENGPCAACEAGIEAAEDFASDPPADVEEAALQRMERMSERWLDKIGGSL